MRAALGFRAHSGWAALVVVSGMSRQLTVIDRMRVELADPGIPRPVQPYHAAQGLDLKEAKEVIERSADGALRMARQGLGVVIDRLRETGYEVVGCGILLGSGRSATTLEATLASHALIHTAEGELFRGALTHASSHYKLPVTGVRERDLYARGATLLGLSVVELQRRVAELGRHIGPPWAQDQKLAAVVAWLALAARPQR